MSFSFFAILVIIVCFLLVVIIMVQNPKGGGLSSTFGGSQQMIGSVQKTNQFLDRATWTLSATVVVLAILSSLTLPKEAQGTYDEILDGGSSPRTELPAAQPIAPAATPGQVPEQNPAQ